MKTLIEYLNDPIILLFVSPIVILPLSILAMALGMHPILVVSMLIVYFTLLVKAINKA